MNILIDIDQCGICGQFYFQITTKFSLFLYFLHDPKVLKKEQFSYNDYIMFSKNKNKNI